MLAAIPVVSTWKASPGIAEVTENVSQCSVVAENIASVSRSSEEISNRSVTVKETAMELSDPAEQLRDLMAGFKLS